MFSNVPFYIWWIVGFIAGFGLELFLCSLRRDGVIHIFHEEDNDRYLFEFNIPPEEIPTMSQVVFITKIAKPENENLNSQNLQSS